MKYFKKYLYCFLLFSMCLSQKVLIPMNNTQNDHLKAYGLVYFMLNKNHNVEWLLNYKGGSFLLNYNDILLKGENV